VYSHEYGRGCSSFITEDKESRNSITILQKDIQKEAASFDQQTGLKEEINK
jgi:hypothetical protein